MSRRVSADTLIGVDLSEGMLEGAAERGELNVVGNVLHTHSTGYGRSSSALRWDSWPALSTSRRERQEASERRVRLLQMHEFCGVLLG